MRNSRSFQGLCPLDPLGAHSAPRPQLELAMIVGYCISCLRHDSPTPPTISHWPAQFCCTPPKNLITRPTDEPPIKNPPKNLLPAGVLLRGVTTPKRSKIQHYTQVFHMVRFVNWFVFFFNFLPVLLVYFISFSLTKAEYSRQLSKITRNQLPDLLRVRLGSVRACGSLRLTTPHSPFLPHAYWKRQLII